MALIAVSGHPGCRFEEVARFTAQRLGFELLTQSRIRALTEAEFGADAKIPDKAYASLVTSILARLASENHMVCCALGGEVQARHFLGMLRVHVVAPENVRIGNLMLDHRLDRGAARALLLELEAADRAGRKARFGKTKATAELFDMVLNAESLSSEQMAELIEAAVASAGLKERGYLSNAAEAQLQFQMRLKLARFGIVPPGSVTLRHKMFAHPSEEMFANLLDFYRIAWEYEPRSFPVQYDATGGVLNRKAARLVFPRDAVEIQQVGEHLLARVREHFVAQRDAARRNDSKARQFQAHLKLQLRLGCIRKVAALFQARGGHGRFDQFRHLFARERFGVKHHVEQLGGGFSFAEPGFAAGPVGGFQLQQQRARGAAVQTVIQHQVADPHIFRRHHVYAQHAQKMAGLHFAPKRAAHHVILRGQPRQNRGHQAGVGLVRDLGICSEFRFGERPDSGLRQQLKTQPLRGEARHLFKTAPRMTRNRDQRHVTRSSYRAPCSLEKTFTPRRKVPPRTQRSTNQSSRPLTTRTIPSLITATLKLINKPKRLSANRR